MPSRLLPALAAGLLLLAGCTPGPAQRSAPKVFGPETLFSQLESVVHFARSDAQSMDLLDPCRMRIRWSDGRERTYDLLRVQTGYPTEDDGERYALLLQAPQQAAPRMLVGTSQWGQYMMARSSIRQLKNLCALSRQGYDFAGGTLRRSADQGTAPRRRAATSP